MYISEASKKSGATQRAIRLYESLGLLKVVRSGKYRTYTDTNITLIQIIKEAQTLGIQLSEIAALKSDEQDLNWHQVSDFLVQKQHDIEVEIQALKTQKNRIRQYQKSIEKCLNGLDSDL